MVSCRSTRLSSNVVDRHVNIFDSDLTSVYIVIYWKTLFCYFKWFPGGRLSLCYNAVDRHVDEGNGNKNAIIWDSPITGQKSTRTYAELQDNVSKFSVPKVIFLQAPEFSG